MYTGARLYGQAVEFRPNPLDDAVTGHVVVYFRGLQNDAVETKSTWCDIIIEHIWSKFNSLYMVDGYKVFWKNKVNFSLVIICVSYTTL